jgi:hypothetical protein
MMPAVVDAYRTRLAERGPETRTLSTAILSTLMAEIAQRDPGINLRLASLLFHLPYSVVHSYFTSRGGATLLASLIEGFSVNGLPDLVEMAHALGITSARWSNG